MDFDAVVMHRHTGRLGLLAILAHRRMELDVVALPNRRGFAGIDERGGNLVDRAAIVVFAVEPIAVKDLHFVPALDVDTAIATSLSLGVGHIRDAELDVELEMAVEFLLGNYVASTGLHDAVVEQLPFRLALAVARQ